MPRRPTVYERSQPLPRPTELMAPELVRLCKNPRTTPKDVLSALRSPDVWDGMNARDSEGRNALHWATQVRNAAVVDLLLDVGVHPDLPDHQGQTPLHLVAWFGQMRSAPARLVTQALWDHMADPTWPDALGRTPVEIAEKLGTRPLLDCLAIPRDLVARMNAFLAKTKQDQFLEPIRRCLDQGVNPNEKMPDGCPWLAAAAGRGSLDTVTLLLAHGASPHDTDSHGMTPLHRSAAYGLVPVIDVLLGASPHVHRHDAAGRTPLFLAVVKGQTRAVELLLEAGSDPLDTGRASPNLLEVAQHHAQANGLYDLPAMLALLQPAVVRWERKRLNEAMASVEGVEPRPAVHPPRPRL